MNKANLNKANNTTIKKQDKMLHLNPKLNFELAGKQADVRLRAYEKRCIVFRSSNFFS